MISYADTEELGLISSEVQTAAEDLEIEIKALFNRLRNVPQETKEWIGGQANYYFTSVAQDEGKYLEFVDSIKLLGQELKKEAEDLQVILEKKKNEQAGLSKG
ncbi:hypothetical protein IKF92_02090 [Candidatus Saccharibacteria bacterium]|nr:hypothetical protein [Candidatus Saccharibacteria bacterium]